MGQIVGWYNSAWFAQNQLCSFMLTEPVFGNVYACLA